MGMRKGWPKGAAGIGLLLGAWVVCAPSVQGADVVSTWDGTTGNWSDAARWDSTDYPDSPDAIDSIDSPDSVDSPDSADSSD